MNPTEVATDPPAHLIDKDATYLTSRGVWHFTRQDRIDGSQLEEFWKLYALAFEPLKRHSVARQVLTYKEFADQMVDERVSKFIAWDELGSPIGLTTLTTALDSVPWISPDYFEAHYPDHWARNEVYYLGFTLAHPSQRHRRFIDTLVEVVVSQLVGRQAVVAYDICSFNNEVLRFQDRISERLAPYPGVQLDLVDTQLYVCVSFR